MSREDRSSRVRRDKEEHTRSRRGSEEDDTRSSRRGTRDESTRSKRGSEDDSVRTKRSSKARDYVYKKMSAEDRQNRKPPKYGGKYPIAREDSVDIFKTDIKDENRIRFVPQTWSEEQQHYAFRVRIHSKVGPAGKEKFLCLADMLGKPCPICEEREKAIKEGEPKEYTNSLWAWTSWFAYVVDRNDRKSKTPKLIKMSDTLDDDIVAVAKDDDGAILCIDDPERGYDVSFEAYKQGDYTKMRGVSVARKSSELDEAFLDYAIENPIPDLLIYHDYDFIADVFYGDEPTTKRKDNDEPEDRSRKSSKKKEPTYDDVMEMNEDALIDTCIDDLGISEKDTLDMTKRQMKAEIIGYFKLEEGSDEEDSEDAEHESKLDNMRRRRRE